MGPRLRRAHVELPRSEHLYFVTRCNLPRSTIRLPLARLGTASGDLAVVDGKGWSVMLRCRALSWQRRRRGVATVAAAIAVMSLVGCTGGAGTHPDDRSLQEANHARTGTPSDLFGVMLQATSVTGQHQIVPGTILRLQLEPETVRAGAGCNAKGAKVVVTDGRLKARSVESSAMGCAPERLRQDEWLSDFLMSSPIITVTGNELTLANNTDTIVLTPAPGGRDALIGMGWRVAALASERNSRVEYPQVAVTASLRFTDTKVSLDTGCNRGSSPVAMTNDSITFGPVTITEAGCPVKPGDSPDAVSADDIERTMLAVTEGRATWTLERNFFESRLWITSTDWTAGLILFEDPLAGLDPVEQGGPTN